MDDKEASCLAIFYFLTQWCSKQEVKKCIKIYLIITGYFIIKIIINIMLYYVKAVYESGR